MQLIRQVPHVSTMYSAAFQSLSLSHTRMLSICLTGLRPTLTRPPSPVVVHNELILNRTKISVLLICTNGKLHHSQMLASLVTNNEPELWSHAQCPLAKFCHDGLLQVHTVDDNTVTWLRDVATKVLAQHIIRHQRSRVCWCKILFLHVGCSFQSPSKCLNTKGQIGASKMSKTF